MRSRRGASIPQASRLPAASEREAASWLFARSREPKRNAGPMRRVARQSQQDSRDKALAPASVGIPLPG